MDPGRAPGISACGPTRTCCDVRSGAAVGGQGDIKRVQSAIPIYEYTA